MPDRSPREKNRLAWNIAIVGAGKVGSVLGRILVERGENIVAVVSRTEKSAGEGGRFLKCRNIGTSLDIIPPATDLIYLTTPHDAVELVAANLAHRTGLNFRDIAVCHASGMLTAGVLKAVKAKGARVFSFHPLQTFPRDFAPKDIVPAARGIYYAVDGTPAALRIAGEFADRLGGSVISVPPDRRVLYHAACVLASNHLTTMMSLLAGMYQRMGKNRQDFFSVFKPIIMATLANIERTSPEDALSGPIARGGIETVDAHFKAIRKHAPELLPYFGAMTLETVTLARRKGSIDALQTRALHDLVESHIHQNSHSLETL